MQAANEAGYSSPQVSELAAAKEAAARMMQELEAGKKEVAAARASAARMALMAQEMEAGKAAARASAARTALMAQEMAAMRAELTGLKVHIHHAQ